MKLSNSRYVMEVLEEALVTITLLDKDTVDSGIYERMSKALNILDQEVYAEEIESKELRPLNFHDPDDMMEFDGDDDD